MAKLRDLLGVSGDFGTVGGLFAKPKPTYQEDVQQLHKDELLRKKEVREANQEAINSAVSKNSSTISSTLSNRPRLYVSNISQQKSYTV